MNFSEYQRATSSTAIYPESGALLGLLYTVLGAAGEAGELANKVKKILRDNKNYDREILKDELGDLLWYVAMIAHEIGYDLDIVAIDNVQKLQSRKERGKLHGSGDNR